jgi:hypothetical protein
MHERRLSVVPKLIFIVLVSAIFAQVAWNNFVQSKKLTVQQSMEQLSSPPSIKSMRLASFGEPIALSKLSMLYLQAFDNQAGQQISLSQLNYQQVQAWLSRIIELDPPSQYPLFAASYLYGEVSNQSKQRVMLHFIYQEFLKDPNRRWRSLAHATTLAKHRLKDLALARQYAQALRLYATGEEVPSWAKQMEIFILEDMDELQSAKILLGGLLQSGHIRDPHEVKFLEQKLVELEEKTKANTQSKSKN